MASRRMSLSVHWDGQLDMDGNGPRYFGGRKKLIAIRSNTTYANFERRMYRLINCNREECCLKYTIRCPTGANEYIAYDIVDDESLEGLIGLFEHYGCVSLYIEKDLYPSETQYQSQGYYTSLLHNDIDVGFSENPIGDREVDNEPGTESVSTCATLDFTCRTLDVTCATVDVTCATLDVTCRTLEIIWRPYTDAVLEVLPAFCVQDSEVWRSRATLICFHIVELHVPDRVLRQFGLLQHIPIHVETIRRFTSQGRPDEHWGHFHAAHIERWGQRLQVIIDQDPIVGDDPVQTTSIYMELREDGFLVQYSVHH
ncbi:Serine/threonine-protein phosphatase [Ananas comosus]|uniref:Serine/threonine-protein phosphatase n=1 Tax=Ananas comosus TaxID=4615 RepID=A0A199W111_ANACO|nr:Serine/threonine-protein phosphatase [Ananas comosus]